MEVKKIVEGMTAPQVAQVIDDNFKAQNKILEEDIATQNSVIGVSEYKDFSEAEAVAVGDVRLYDVYLYECVEATTGAFDASKWKKSSFKAETEKKLSELGSEVGAKASIQSLESEVSRATAEEKRLESAKLNKSEIEGYKAEIYNKVASQDNVIDDFKEAITDQVNNYKPVEINGNVTNAADEEDITSENGLLKLKDRSALNGMGHVILRQNKSFAEQVTIQNTIYEIRYDFDLNGEEITIPEGCVLDFQGGSLRNGIVVGNYTIIAASLTRIFGNNIKLTGKWNIKESYPQWFGAKGDGVTDDTIAIQKTFDNFTGNIHLPVGVYTVSKTIILRNNTMVYGSGAGAYFRGSGYQRLTVIKPSVEFEGNVIFDADPKYESADAYYTWGISLRNMLFDCINICNDKKTIVSFMSLTNSETSENIRIINNNTNIGLAIGRSQNVNSYESDGLVISNFYFIDAGEAPTEGNNLPVCVIGPANEIAIRDCKFQRGGNYNDVGSTALLIDTSYSNNKGRAVQGITIDNCSFTSAETGVRIKGNYGFDANGPRYIRVINGTWEYCKFSIHASSDHWSVPVQFCDFSHNRMNVVPEGGFEYYFGSNSNDNIIVAHATQDIFIDNDNTGNLVIGGSSKSQIGSKTLWIRNEKGKFAVNNGIEWQNINELLNGWVNKSTSNRNIAQYSKDTFGVVRLRGYLGDGKWGYPNYIFTLPEDVRPKKTYECNAVGDDGVLVTLIIESTGGVFAKGSGSRVVLDGVSFSTE